MKIKNLNFEKFIDNLDIKKQIKNIAQEINLDYSEKNPVFIPILDGSFMFAAELYANIKIKSEISFVRYKSYQGTESSNLVEDLGIEKNILGRDVIIVEDIVETGKTLHFFIENLKKCKVNSFKIASLFSKPSKHSIPIDYVGFEIPDNFIVGFGLDYDNQGRNIPHVMRVSDMVK